MREQPSRTKVRQCLHSIISRKPRCIVCGAREDIELHHVFGGKYRKLSDRYGLTVCLCKEHHRGADGVHGGNRALDEALKRLAEHKFAEYYGHDLFKALFSADKRHRRRSACNKDVHGV